MADQACRTAFSKVNLFLKVTGCRDNGYHELSTLFWPLPGLADSVTILFDAAPGIQVGGSSGMPSGMENIAGRAALAYAEKTSIAPTWEIGIEKKIPVAAGLGGGSSDAAAVLKLLNGRYRMLSGEELAALAVGLGADVPFFLKQEPAVAGGIGEKLSVLSGSFPNLPLVLVNPRFPVSTQWGYSHLEPDRIGPVEPGRLEKLIAALKAGDLPAAAEALHNDLAFALYRKFPFLVMLRDFLLSHGALNAEVSGSGPTLFALCPSPEKAQELRRQLQNRFGEEILVFEVNA